MLLASNKSIEDKIIELLSSKPLISRDIWSEINSRSPTTIQGVYKSIRRLLKDDIIVKAGGIISLNQEWVEKVGKLLNTKNLSMDLHEGESISYKFKGLSELDAYWKHTIKNFLKNLPGPIFHCEPHEIWIYLEDRFKSQTEYLRSFNENSRYGFLIFGSNTYKDREYKNKYQNNFVKIDLDERQSFVKRNRYTTIVGDVIVTTILTDSISKKIDTLYNSTLSIDNNFGEKIREILKQSGQVKLYIEKNSLKAKKIRKKLSKNFFISKEFADKFQLF